MHDLQFRSDQFATSEHLFAANRSLIYEASACIDAGPRSRESRKPVSLRRLCISAASHRLDQDNKSTQYLSQILYSLGSKNRKLRKNGPGRYGQIHLWRRAKCGARSLWPAAHQLAHNRLQVYMRFVWKRDQRPQSSYHEITKVHVQARPSLMLPLPAG
jgi:hypothetical protein